MIRMSCILEGCQTYHVGTRVEQMLNEEGIHVDGDKLRVVLDKHGILGGMPVTYCNLEKLNNKIQDVYKDYKALMNQNTG